MVSKIQQLEIELAKAKTEAQTWEKAFKLMTHHGVPVNDEVLKKVRSKKTVVEKMEEGEKMADMFLKTNNVQEIEQQLQAQASGQSFGVQNVALSWLGTYIREQIVEVVVSFIKRLIKENAVAVADWLLGQAEDKIIDGFMRLSEEDRELFKNQLRETPRFAELLKKIEAQEQNSN
jgi:hypothetical protein